MSQFFPQLETTDANPVLLPTAITVPEDTTAVLRGTVAASDHNGGDATWEMDIAVRRIADGQPQFLGLPIKKNSPTAALWSCTVSFSNDGRGEMRVQVTGEAGKTIQWVYVHEDFYGMIGRILNSASRTL
jgi:hypothetical protein